jgi:hypothetical protein
VTPETRAEEQRGDVHGMKRGRHQQELPQHANANAGAVPGRDACLRRRVWQSEPIPWPASDKTVDALWLAIRAQVLRLGPRTGAAVRGSSGQECRG